VNATGSFGIQFQGVNTTGGFNTTTNPYLTSLFDLIEATIDSKNNTKFTTASQVILNNFETTMENANTYVSNFAGNSTGRFTSLKLTSVVADGGSVKTTVNLDGYVWQANNTYLTFRWFLTGGDKCKVNSDCNASALFTSGGVTSVGVVVNDGFFFSAPQAQSGAALPLTTVLNVSVLYQNGAILINYPQFVGNLVHDPTSGLQDSPNKPTINLVDLKSTWWFGWSYTTWYIILAVVGVIVLLALVALIGAIIVWNRGKPGYEQV